ncbi:hypothetical protein CAPTEDRAFT_195268 [Capitella teleta]|uniref:C-type lectin domain-containing protein n=1 Tax=Capitella teleta TaxID=283909 RepID=R7TVB2_CAPTE|nr:hypothetical protein CAPTEDRAFT_195268 [Capitella teleta]|eukprot:ELT94955.1 hypothetical protein CAPTEDRAFT_195268 [Capitella teleta]
MRYSALLCLSSSSWFNASSTYKEARRISALDERLTEKGVSLEGSLSQIRSDLEQLAGITESQSIILGWNARNWFTAANDIDTEGVWRWADVDRPFSVDQCEWSPNEPNNALSGEDCGVLEYSEVWMNDRHCQYRCAFICEYKAV